MVTTLDSVLSAQNLYAALQGCNSVFLDKAFYSHSVSLHHLV